MNPLITAVRLRRFAPNCDASALAPPLQAAAERFDIDTPARSAMWLAMMHTESRGLVRLVESLTYSAERLCQVWPGRFPTLAAAAPYANNPQALARKAYGGRMGNNLTDDGFRFRGRGYIQITGRSNYEHYGQILGLDLLGNPDAAAEPGNAALIAGAYWREHHLNIPADRGDVKAVTLAVNGGTTGLADRALQFQRAKVALAA